MAGAVFEGACRDNPASYLLPLGNFVNGLVGVLLVAPFLRSITEALQVRQPDLAKLTAKFHITFNVLTAFVFIGLLDGMAQLLENFYRTGFRKPIRRGHAISTRARWRPVACAGGCRPRNIARQEPQGTHNGQPVQLAMPAP